MALGWGGRWRIQVKWMRIVESEVTLYNYFRELSSMSQQLYTKFTNVQSSKDIEHMPKRIRPARQSEPPMMSSQSAFQMSSPPDNPKPKQYLGLDSANKTPYKPMGDIKDLDRLAKNTANYKSSEQGPNSASKLEEVAQSSNPQLQRTLTAGRFMSPELKTVGPQHVRPNQRKYSSQISDIGSNSKSVQQLSNTPLGPPRLSHQTHSTGTTSHKLPSSVNTTPLPKRQPRYSEPVNFSMDTLDTPETSSNSATQQMPSPGSMNKQKDTLVKTPSYQTPADIAALKSNAFTPSSFKKQKQLKQTVSTHSTFNSIEESSKLVNKIEKNSTQKKSGDPIKLTDFVKGKQIGSGKFGSVYIVKHKATGFICALKCIPKDVIKEEGILNQLTRQLKIQMYLDHPNIIKLYGFFHDKDNIYLLLELGSSGQLYKVIKQKSRLEELSASYTIKQVCEAVRYLHYFKIIHRDLKPENIVIQSGTVKLCDFGWAVCRGTELRNTFCGTPLYVSPQILKGQSYDQKIDLWSIGILTYELLFGNIPFEINREEQLYKIIKQDIVFPQHITVSEQAKDFILRILKKNPTERLKIGQLLEHPFLKKSPELAPELQN